MRLSLYGAGGLLAVLAFLTGCQDEPPTAPTASVVAAGPAANASAPTDSPLPAETSHAVAAPAAEPRPATPIKDTPAANVAPVPVKKADWPGFLGPQRNGLIAPANWSPELSRGVKTVWRTNVGIGYSSISVAGGKAYTMGYRDGRDEIFCFDALTGEQIWKIDYECSLVDNLHDGGPGATPTVDGDWVYTLSRDGHFHCLNAATGEIRWLVMTPKLTGVERPEWGLTSSPLIDGDLAIVEVGAVLAVNKNTGEVVWQSDKYAPGYGSPVLFPHQGQKLIAVLNNEGLLLVSAETGKTIAREPSITTDYSTNSATPVLLDGDLFISTGYQRGCSRWKLVDGSLERVFETRAVSSHMANCVQVGDYLYGIDGNSHSSRNCKLVCVDSRTGQRLWEERGCGCGSVLTNGRELLMLTEDGRLVTVAASPDGYKEIAQKPVLSATCWTPPAVAGRHCYCRNAAGDLVCVELPPAGDAK
ncbi:outer membrane biogenesis protein BamB [Lignipirellula cremea]|uniref:Outer membrane biogenesis protein BamB n=2 Tax=Lignipirellula cremea TaxID=2528010 RepID=A0A518DLH3_9BACT|nr:outer membrane biogenesis protein BamB [Lignipirellula cremea]